MKQRKIMNAYAGLEALAKNTELSEKEQWQLYQLRKILRPHFDFQAEREEAMREKYSDYIGSDGQIAPEKRADWMNDLNELLNMDVDVEIDEKPQIRFVKGVNLMIAEPLEDFVDFIQM